MNKERSRNWNITIHHKERENFKELENYINEFKENQKLEQYFYIIHEAEEEDKEEHIHLILTFKNEKSFKQIQELFKGSHIEPTKDKIQSIKYLLHLGIENKKQYSIEQIFTNDINYTQWVIKNTYKEKFNSNDILKDIYENGLTSITEFYIKYGSQIQQYIYLIKTLIQESKEESILNNILDNKFKNN